MSLCIFGGGGGGGGLIKLAVSMFTLAWTHTIEKIPWEEDWRIEGNRLVLEEVRIKGSGAGMEPAPDARLEAGFYRWNPKDDSRMEIILRRAPEAGDWRLCWEGTCRNIGDMIDTDPVSLKACSAVADEIRHEGMH